MSKRLFLALAIAIVPSFPSVIASTKPVTASTKSIDSPQVIKLQRFRKALLKVHVTVKGKSGDFLLDTGGGVTLLTEQFSKGLECEFWGRTTGFNMFGKKSEGPHCDNVQILAGD